jgi:hypothetical protein
MIPLMTKRKGSRLRPTDQREGHSDGNAANSTHTEPIAKHPIVTIGNALARFVGRGHRAVKSLALNLYYTHLALRGALECNGLIASAIMLTVEIAAFTNRVSQ